MRLDLKTDHHAKATSVMMPVDITYWLAPGQESDDSDPEDLRDGHQRAEHEELPYKVELWDETKMAVEQILAVTASGSIGYAAYYAATREFPHRYVTLRHKNRIVSRWNGPGH